MPAKSNLELPFWLAQGFMELQMVKVQLPKYFHPEFIRVFNADSEIANLRDKSYYFFELAKHISTSFRKFYEYTIFKIKIIKFIIFLLYFANI